MQRREAGGPIRRVMQEAGLTITALAERTKQVDPAGYGVSKSLVGSMVSRGSTGRENYTDRSAELVATALDHPVEALFITGSTHAADGYIRET